MKNLIKKFNMLSEYVELHGSSCDWKSVQENLVNLINGDKMNKIIDKLKKFN